MKVRLRQALEHAFAAGPRVTSVRLPVRPTADTAVRRRVAGETAVTLQPISVPAPRPETAADVHEFVLEQFPPAARRLAA